MPQKVLPSQGIKGEVHRFSRRSTVIANPPHWHKQCLLRAYMLLISRSLPKPHAHPSERSIN
jgi:hypothetical protein